LSVILSPKATTGAIIQDSASAFVNSMATAASPVTGTQVNVVSSYANSSGSGFGVPQLGTVGMPTLGG
jgi:hypothetical protein